MTYGKISIIADVSLKRFDEFEKELSKLHHWVEEGAVQALPFGPVLGEMEIFLMFKERIAVIVNPRMEWSKYCHHRFRLNPRVYLIRNVEKGPQKTYIYVTGYIVMSHEHTQMIRKVLGHPVVQSCIIAASI